MATETIGQRLERARAAAGLSQRALAERTGISQSTLSRIEAGDREARTTEVLVIARATGHTVTQLTGVSEVAARLECVARSTNGSQMEAMRQRLIHFLELDAYLDDQGIPTSP